MKAGLFIIVLSAASAPAAPETRPATTQQMKDQERVDIEKHALELAGVGPYKLKDVIRLGVQDGRLFATSTLGATDGEKHVLLSDAPGYCIVSIQPLAGGSLPKPTTSLRFVRDDFSDTAIVYLHTEVLMPPGHFQVVGDTQLLDASRHVTLMDQGSGVGEEGEKIAAETSLRVQFVGEQSDATNSQLLLKAPDLPALTRKYPSETNAYLRPILRELRAESILEVNPLLAWGVLAPEKAPDPQVVTQVKSLLADLDDASFAKRSAASESLKHLGTPGAIVLLHLDRTHLSPEQNTRLDDVLTSYQQVRPEEAAALADQTGFLLDCMGSQDSEIRRVALARLMKKLDRPVVFDPEASDEARQAALDRLRAQLLPPAATRSSEH